MANPPRCGQFTFYFPRCSHATSHPFHLSSSLSSNSSTLCNSNCIYTRTQDYWFYAYENARCSYCGLGTDHGFGTRHPLPTGDRPRMEFFERLRVEGKLGDGAANDDAENGEGWRRTGQGEKFRIAAAQYNHMVDQSEVVVQRREMKGMRIKKGFGEHQDDEIWARRKKKEKWNDRWEIRRLRAQRRTEAWVKNVREEQYAAVKRGWKLGRRPFILANDSNSNSHYRDYTNFQTEIHPSAFSDPVDNCIWCQYPLNSSEGGNGNPCSLPCGHKYHHVCINELFAKRAENKNSDHNDSADEDKEEVYQCPLCKTNFEDVRELPNFYQRYQGFEHEFDSQAEISEISDTEVGDMVGDYPPPWFVERRVEDPILPIPKSREVSGVRKRDSTFIAQRRELPIQTSDVRPDDVQGLRDQDELAHDGSGREVGSNPSTISLHEFMSDSEDSTYYGSDSGDEVELGILQLINQVVDEMDGSSEVTAAVGDFDHDGEESPEIPPPPIAVRRSSRKKDAVEMSTRRSQRKKAIPRRWVEESAEQRYNRPYNRTRARR